MGNRKQVKFKNDVYERLKDEKEDYETWDGLAMRLLEASDGC